MNQRLLSVLTFAFVVSAGASFLLYRLIASRVSANAKQPTVQVILASRNLDLGTLIRDADLKSGDWSGPLPLGAVVKKILDQHKQIESRPSPFHWGWAKCHEGQPPRSLTRCELH